jgi:hypothetical protein
MPHSVPTSRTSGFPERRPEWLRVASRRGFVGLCHELGPFGAARYGRLSAVVAVLLNHALRRWLRSSFRETEYTCVHEYSKNTRV